MRILVLILMLAVMGCATEDRRGKALQSMVGHPVDDLVMQWGSPSKTFKRGNGNSVYTWDQQAGTAAYSAPGSSFAYSAPLYCTTIIEVDKDDKILRWNWSGNRCN